MWEGLGEHEKESNSLMKEWPESVVTAQGMGSKENVLLSVWGW